MEAKDRHDGMDGRISLADFKNDVPHNIYHEIGLNEEDPKGEHSIRYGT